MIYISFQIRRVPLPGMQVIRMSRRAETNVWLLLPVRCIVPGVSSRSGQNWKFHNVQSPTLSTAHTPADNARPSPPHPPTGTHLVSPYVQIPYLNQYLTCTRINELLVNNLPSPHHLNNSSSVCPGKPIIRSMLILSNPMPAASAIPSIA